MKSHIFTEEPPEWARPYYRKTDSVALGFVFVLRRKFGHAHTEDITVVGSHVGIRIKRKRRTWSSFGSRDEALTVARRFLLGHRYSYEIVGPIPIGLDAKTMIGLRKSGEVPSHIINSAYKMALAGAAINETHSASGEES